MVIKTEVGGQRTEIRGQKKIEVGYRRAGKSVSYGIKNPPNGLKNMKAVLEGLTVGRKQE